MTFKVKDYATLKKDFIEQVWGLLIDHNVIEKKNVPEDRKLDMELVKQLPDDRRPDILFLIKTQELLDGCQASLPERARRLTGALMIVGEQIGNTYKIRSPENSYWYKHTPTLIGITDLNTMDPSTKAKCVDRALSFLVSQIYDNGNELNSMRKKHAFSEIVGFNCIEYADLGVDMSAKSKKQVFPQSAAELEAREKAAAAEERKRQAEQDKADGKSTSIFGFGRFWSVPDEKKEVAQQPATGLVEENEEVSRSPSIG